MKNLKQLGILASTTLLTMAVLASCSSEPEADTSGSTGSTDAGTSSAAPSVTPEATPDATPDAPEGEDGVVGDMSLEAEDSDAPAGEESTEEGVPSPEDVENSDPNATPPEGETAEPEAETTPEAEATPEVEPEAEATPEAETAPESSTGSSVDLAGFYNSVIADYEFSMMDKVTGEFLTNFFPGMDAVSTVQQEIYMAMMTASAVEIALVEVTNAADVATVTGILQERIDFQIDGGAWYPETMEAWANQSKIVSNGNVVMMIVHPDFEAISAKFQGLF